MRFRVIGRTSTMHKFCKPCLAPVFLGGGRFRVGGRGPRRRPDGKHSILAKPEVGPVARATLHVFLGNRLGRIRRIVSKLQIRPVLAWHCLRIANAIAKSRCIEASARKFGTKVDLSTLNHLIGCPTSHPDPAATFLGDRVQFYFDRKLSSLTRCGESVKSMERRSQRAASSWGKMRNKERVPERYPCNDLHEVPSRVCHRSLSIIVSRNQRHLRRRVLPLLSCGAAPSAVLGFRPRRHRYYRPINLRHATARRVVLR
jgi:hypothetical protein